MKKEFCIILMFATLNINGQSIPDQIKDVKTYEDAEKIINLNSNLRLEAINLNSSIDTSIFHKLFYSKNIGDIFTIDQTTYKVLYKKPNRLSRVNYIFLDGSKLSRPEIDSIRQLIIKKYKSGVSFDSLATEYSMDGNQNFGDTNWFSEDLMVKEFSDAVLKHKMSDIFTVDVTQNNWFYVVKKTYETQTFIQLMAIQVRNGG